MRIIGIDPGTVCCGYGLVDTPNNRDIRHVTSGEIKLNRKDALPDRLLTLHESLTAIIHEFRPSHLCLEKIFYHKSIHSAFALGSARGVVLLVAAENRLPVSEYNSTSLKMALTGYGRAEKRQVQEMVKRILHLDASKDKLGEDSADALALCICHIHSTQKSK